LPGAALGQGAARRCRDPVGNRVPADGRRSCSITRHRATGWIDLSATYIGIFFGSGPAAGGGCRLASGVAALLEPRPNLAHGGPGGESGRRQAGLALNGSFHVTSIRGCRSCPGLPMPLTDDHALDAERSADPDPPSRPSGRRRRGLLLQLERRGAGGPWVLDPLYDLLFTDRYQPQRPEFASRRCGSSTLARDRRTIRKRYAAPGR